MQYKYLLREGGGSADIYVRSNKLSYILAEIIKKKLPSIIFWHEIVIDFNEADVWINCCSFFFSGSCQEKLHLLFRMFDMDGKGCLERDELSRMFG